MSTVALITELEQRFQALYKELKKVMDEVNPRGKTLLTGGFRIT
jgi:hypothetical protein